MDYMDPDVPCPQRLLNLITHSTMGFPILVKQHFYIESGPSAHLHIIWKYELSQLSLAGSSSSFMWWIMSKQHENVIACTTTGNVKIYLSKMPISSYHFLVLVHMVSDIIWYSFVKVKETLWEKCIYVHPVPADGLQPLGPWPSEGAMMTRLGSYLWINVLDLMKCQKCKPILYPGVKN